MKNLSLLNFEIPAIEKDKEGRLKGGFVGISMPGMRTDDPDTLCDDLCKDKCACNKRDMCHVMCRMICKAVCECEDENPTTLPGEEVTDPTKPTEDADTIGGELGFSLLF